MQSIIAAILIFILFVLTNQVIESGIEADRIYTDPRDGQVYETVEIGERIWFKENLNFRSPMSLCYDSLESNCNKYGRLYPLSEAVLACPEYWRLPDYKDIELLYKIAGTNRIGQIAPPGEWDVKGSGKFENSTGLSILPAGRIDSFSIYATERNAWVDTLAFHQKGIAASYWLNDKETSDGVLHWHIGEPIGEIKSGTHRHRIFPEIHKFSIRCVCHKKEMK